MLPVQFGPSVGVAQLATIRQMSRQVSRGSAADYEADEKGRSIEAQLAIIKQISRQVSPGSAGDYQADKQAGVAGLRWRVSGR